MDHNDFQKAYFERTVKRTMVPVDTPYLRRHVAEALREAELSPGDRILEVGCGMGRYTLLLAAHGLRVEGLDLSAVLLERLQGFNAGRFPLRLHAGDLTEAAAGLEGSFDAVLGFFVLHHVESLESCFRAVARVLRPGGRAVFLEPNPYNPLYYVQIAVTPGMSFRGESGLVQMRPGPLFAAMRAAGLEDPRCRRFGFFPPQVANLPGAPRAERMLEAVRVLGPVLPFQIFRAHRA